MDPCSKESEEANGGGEGQGIAEWAGLRSIVIPRSESGFGFTLRHFVVFPPQSVLDDSKSENECDFGGRVPSCCVKEDKVNSNSQGDKLEPQDTIFVKSVKPGSCAHSAGLNIGDRVVAVNGESVSGKTYGQVISVIQASTKSLKLLVVPKDEDVLQMACRSEVGETLHASNISKGDTDSVQERLIYRQDQTTPCHKLPSSPRYYPLSKDPVPNPHQDQPVGDNRNNSSQLQFNTPSPRSQESTGKMSIASNIPSKTKYSFGLYFPPKTTTVSNSTSSSSLSKTTISKNVGSVVSCDSSSVRVSEDLKMSKPADSVSSKGLDAKQRKSSLDETSQKSSSARSRDFFIRYTTDKSNSDARNRYALRHSTHERASIDKPTYLITRSQTVCTLSPVQSTGNSSRSRSSGDFTKLTRKTNEDPEYKTELSRHVHQVPSSSLESRTGIKLSSYPRDAGLASHPSTSSNPSIATTSNSKTLVVQIPCDQQQPVVTISQGRETTNQTPVRQSYGTAFALKRTPLATHIEIQKAIGKPIVSQRKSQFELKSDEPPQVSRIGNQHNRYKKEIDRIRTQPKFSSFASRKASFELSPERDIFEEIKQAGMGGSLDETSSADNQSPTPVIKIRKISAEKKHTPGTSHSVFRERSSTTPSSSTTGTLSYLESSPIRIYVSPGMNKTLSSSSSPIVEIVCPSTESENNRSVKTNIGESTQGTSSSNFQEDVFYQRLRSSPSPSNLSTGTMGDSGVWVKSYHGSCDMLDSNTGSSGGDTVTTTPGATVSGTDASQESCSSFPRHRHHSYLEAISSPKGHVDTPLSTRVQQQQQPYQPLPAYRGVHTLPPQPMLAVSQTIPQVSSTSAMPVPSPTPVSMFSTQSQTSGGVHIYTQAQSHIMVPPVSLGSRSLDEVCPSDMNAAPPQHHHHHLQQPSIQLSSFPASSSSHSLNSLGSDTAHLSCLGPAATSASDSTISVSGPASKGSVGMATSKPSTSKPSHELGVSMRRKQQESQEDQASKLHRRTSYLMATAKDRTNTVPIEQAFSPQQQKASEQEQSSPTLGGSVRRESSVKLNKFFGEEIPSISEGSETKSVDEDSVATVTPPPTPPPEIIRKGHLSCKIAVMEGKKCSDRTWKPVYGILRQTEMFLTRDAQSSASGHFENQHIPLKSCMVEFARDYAKKKKNVFRLTTHQECEYLFQAEDRGTMLCWIQAIKSINEPEKAEKMDEMIAHETSKHAPVPVEINVVPSSKLSPPLGHMAKKLSGLSLRSKLTSSPNMRRKKSNASEKDKEKPEKEEHGKKGWKGRMMKNLKKHSEDSLAPPSSLEVEPPSDACRQFGMPIEDCFPSPHNEYVPLIVELCTRIVEARGLEIVGVYRVPGNSAAVNALVEEFNRGIDYVNIDNEKLLDINVISSLLKSFFRKLPEPLVNAESYDGFIEANRNPDPDKRMLKIKRLLHLLPTHHNETFKHMAEHLNKVASYGNINKMDAKNLAIMFGPTLIRKSHDDAVSLVTDMSDQCRIIESIILHHEWFFSQWDQDSHIPLETKVEMVQPDEGHGEKDDDEEADSTISTKEIISSIVGAASRKLRGQQQKSEDSLDSACSVFSPNVSSQDGSKSFYHESKVGEASSRLTSLTSSKSHTSLASSQSEGVLSGQGLMNSNQRMAQDFHHTHITNSEPDFLDLEFADAVSSATSSFSRHLSDDSVLEKDEELAMSHGLGTGMTQQSIHNTLMRIGNDVKTLLQTFEQKQLLEMERRHKEQELIEHEQLRSQVELEQEDSHSINDWLAIRGAGGFSSQMPDLVSSSYIGDTFPYGANQYSSVLSEFDRREQVERNRNLKSGWAHPLHPPASFHSHHGSLSSAVSRTSSDNLQYEEFLPPPALHHLIESSQINSTRNQPLKKVPTTTKQKNIHLAVDKQHIRPGSFRLSYGRRHGSLDSLIDLIDKRSSWASSDSEDGSDLLTSLTTTFDQKLQILVNPKYKLTGNSSRKHYSNDLVRQATIVSDMKDTASWRPGDTLRSKSSLLPGTSIPSSVLDSERPFRDPSLHRSSKPEVKIGIASRFERNDNRALSSSPIMNSSDSVSSEQKSPRKAPMPEYGAFLNRQNGQSLREGTVSLTQPKRLEDNGVYVLKSLNKSRGSNILRPISKSEKTEMNSNLARLSKEEKSLTGSEEGDKQENKENKRKRKNDRKQGHRRHTVGGTRDFEHIDALVQVCCSAEEEEDSIKLSAWDQLQPAVKDGGNRNLQSWLQKERTRGSTPDLTIED